MEKYIPTDSEYGEAKKTMTNTEAAASEFRASAYGDALAAGITPEEMPEIKFTKTVEERKNVWRGKVGDHEIVIKVAPNNASDIIEATVNGDPIDPKTAQEILSRYNNPLFNEQGPLGYGVGIEENAAIKRLRNEKDLKDILPPKQKHPADNY